MFNADETAERECGIVTNGKMQGGTLIGTARSKTFCTPEGRLSAAYNLISEGIGALVVCGALTGVDVFRAEWQSLLESLHAQGKITPE